MEIWEATVSARGQVTLPKEMRDALNLRPGDQLIYSVINGKVFMTPKNIDLKDLAGFLGDPPNGRATLDEIDAAVLAAAGSNVLKTGEDDSTDVAA